MWVIVSLSFFLCQTRQKSCRMAKSLSHSTAGSRKRGFLGGFSEPRVVCETILSKGMLPSFPKRKSEPNWLYLVHIAENWPSKKQTSQDRITLLEIKRNSLLSTVGHRIKKESYLSLKKSNSFPSIVTASNENLESQWSGLYGVGRLEKGWRETWGFRDPNSLGPRRWFSLN